MNRLILFILACCFVSTIHAQTIIPTQTDEIIIDNGASGKADPNDRIRYKVTIQNTGGVDGTGTQLNIVPDPRTTFVPGSFRSSPLALPDGPYACTGNVGITVPAASGLKANDFDDNIAAALVSAGTFATTQGGSIVITADGGFSYTPPAGFTGSDTYSYTLNDGNPVGLPVPLTDMATVTFTVSNMIWFISNVGGGSGGAGTRLNPFKTLADFNVASGTAAGHVVHLQFTGTNYPGGIVLKNNMHLFGTGHSGGVTLADVLPFALAPNSPTLPAINGTRPVLENSAGDGILLASTNTIRGLNIGNCSDFGIDDNGNVGTLTISELNISTSGGGFRADNGGTLAVTLGSLASTGGTNGLHLGTTSGTFSVTGSTSITNSSGIGINIASTSGGAVSFNTLTVGGSGSHGIELASNAATFTVTGNTTLNSPVAGGNLSLFISSGMGAITFAGIDINGRRDKGIRIAGGSRTIITGALDIDNPNSTTTSAIEITNSTGGIMAFGATTINNNGANGTAIEIQNNTASISFASGSGITNCAGTDFFCNLGTGNITFDGSINSTSGGSVTVQFRSAGTVSFPGNITHNAAATAININNNTGGIINFSGTSKSLISGAQNAVSLVNNTGANINITGGGLVISTTSGTGFNATGGGTVTVQGTGNTITSTTGTALNAANTTIGASNLNFQSISKNGGTNGIVLNTTGSLGGLTVTGTGSAGSGGTIQNCTGAGVTLTSTAKVNLAYMNIQGSGDDGIEGSGVTDFALSNCTVTNNGNTSADEGIYLVNLRGTSSITNCSVTNNAHNNFWVYNDSGTLTALTVTVSTFEGHNNASANGNHGFLFDVLGSAVVTSVNVMGSTFRNNKVIGMQVLTGDNSTISGFIVSGCTFSDTGTGNSQEISVDFSAAGTSSMTYKFLNNNITGHNSHGFNTFTATGAGTTGTFNATISGNIIGNAAVAGSGSLIGNGLRININGDKTARILVDNNVIRQCPNGRGIEVICRNGTGGADVTVTNNNVNTNDVSGFPLCAILVQSNDLTVPNMLRANVLNNTVLAGTTFDVINTFIGLVETGTSTLQLVDSPPASANATAELTSTNTGSASASAGVSLIAGPINLPPL